MSGERPVKPLFCDDEGRGLFAAHWRADGGDIGAGVLLCNQIGPDYGEYYKTGRLLAGMLTARGLDCLRFDYYGWGDSAGAATEGTVEGWIGDIECAQRAFGRLADIDSLYLCAFGFGATLASILGSRLGNTARLVMWDPVFDGKEYCRYLRRRHKEWMRGSFAKATRKDRIYQAMGFPTGRGLMRQIERVHLGSLGTRPAREVMVVQDCGVPDTEELVSCLTRLGAEVSFQVGASSRLPVVTMRAVVKWLARR